MKLNSHKEKWTTWCIEPDWTVHRAIAQIDQNRLGIVLVVDKQMQLVGTITDGDIRRAILASMSMQSPVSDLLKAKAHTRFARPVWGRMGQEPTVYLKLLNEHDIRHLPILDPQGKVVDLITLEDLYQQETLPVQALIMAGGTGTRLRPLTNTTPKPMLDIGGRPLMEIIVQQLKEAGIQRVNISTYHQPEKITQHFGDGQRFGVDLTYVPEERPLGTAGALGLMEPPKETLLVINGDILTDVNFKAMLAYHREHQADLTVAVRHYDVKVPYGVVECDGSNVLDVKEKPMVDFFVNAGIYLLEPEAFAFIPRNTRYDMTDLIRTLIQAKRPVVSFPIREYWLDIGEPDEYQKADRDIQEGKVRLQAFKGEPT